MKKIGLIGGVGPESTIEYYQQIIKRYRELTTDNSYPDFLIKNIDMSKMIGHVVNKEYDNLVHFLKERINDLENAQVDFGAIASNTPHIVFDELQKQVNLPLISIVDETCIATQKLELKTVALFGTKSTMTAGFYQNTAKKYGINIVTPTENQMDYIHDKYMNELVIKNLKTETKEGLLAIAKDLQEKYNIEGLILGGTELPLILNQKDFDTIKIIDSGKIHVDAIVKMMISK